MNIEALASRRPFDRQRLVFGRPASRGARGMGRMHRVHQDDDLVRGQGIHQIFVALDDRALLVFVEMTRNDLGFAIFEAEAMQKRDQSRAAVIFHAEFRRDPSADPSADPTRRARPSRSNPRHELLSSPFAQSASAAAGFKAHQRLSASLGEPAMPATDRVVVQQERPGDLLAAHASVEPHNSVGASRQSMRNRAIAPTRSGLNVPLETKSRGESCSNRIHLHAIAKSFSPSQ